MSDATVVVRFRKAGMHFWSDAPPGRAYLGTPHRHLFHVEARVTVSHDDREIEFHDFLAFCSDTFEIIGQTSCETAARGLVQAIQIKWPGRAASASVFEDGECGALVEEREG